MKLDLQQHLINEIWRRERKMKAEEKAAKYKKVVKYDIFELIKIAKNMLKEDKYIFKGDEYLGPRKNDTQS